MTAGERIRPQVFFLDGSQLRRLRAPLITRERWGIPGNTGISPMLRGDMKGLATRSATAGPNSQRALILYAAASRA